MWSGRRRPAIEVEARVVDAPRPDLRELRGDLRDVRFEPPSAWVRFRGATLERVDFRGLRLEHLSFDRCTVEECDFSRLRVAWTPFALESTFRGCRFDGADLSGAPPHRTRFERCSFAAAKLGWVMPSGDFVDCRFAGDLGGVVFDGRELGEFRGNDFRDCDLGDVGFRGGVDLDAQLLPADGLLRLDRFGARLASTRRAVAGWPEPDRRTALAMLAALRVPGDDQDEQLISPATEREYWQPVADRVLELLRQEPEGRGGLLRRALRR